MKALLQDFGQIWASMAADRMMLYVMEGEGVAYMVMYSYMFLIVCALCG